ncbi:MAG: class I SAM-dependent methyltransferase [Polyangiaceae bacterium]
MDPRLFRGTVKYYLKYRSTYPVRLIERVAWLCQLTRSSRVLDLGSGPGILARAFAPHCGEVVCVDPEPGMIEMAREHLADLGSKASFLCASAEEMPCSLGPFSLVAIGRAFHWMDRTATLKRLDSMLDTSGAVVLFRDPAMKLPENDWRKEFDAVFSAFATTEAARLGARTLPIAIDEAHLLRSSFCELERISAVETRSLTIDHAVGRAFSMAGASPGDLGDRLPAFEEAMRSALAPFAPSGTLTEITEPQALIARRPR